jgi:hypothetical protein
MTTEHTVARSGKSKRKPFNSDVADYLLSRPRLASTTRSSAIVRAHRWRDMLESGRYATIRDLAKAEAINKSYLGRILRLTLLLPTIIEAILEGRQPATLQLDDLLKQFPIEWDNRLEMLTES